MYKSIYISLQTKTNSKVKIWFLVIDNYIIKRKIRGGVVVEWYRNRGMLCKIAKTLIKLYMQSPFPISFSLSFRPSFIFVTVGLSKLFLIITLFNLLVHTQANINIYLCFFNTSFIKAAVQISIQVIYHRTYFSLRKYLTCLSYKYPVRMRRNIFFPDIAS